jgi:hypothetical protein
VAIPLAFVTAVDPPVKLALAPLVGTVNVTVTPLIGVLLALITVACKAVPKAVLTAVLCGVPAVAVMVDPFPASAAPFNVTFPLLPELITQLTVKVCPAVAAL